MNQVMMQFFEWYYPNDGSLWNKVGTEVETFKELGIDTIWLPPAFKGVSGSSSEGYDVYDIYDLGEFDQKGTIRTKYGTREEYIAAIENLQKHKIRVLVDVVLNHMGGADEKEKIMARKVDPENRNVFIEEPVEIEADTKFLFPGRNKKYSDFVWDYHCFTGIDHDTESGERGIYKIINEYGDTWEEVVGEEKGNFDYLMFSDIESRNPAVLDELKRWGKWYFETVRFDGLRLDALKHISPHFYNEWLSYMKTQVKPDLIVIGEFWTSGTVDVLEKYIEATGAAIQLFDAPLHYNFHTASIEGSNYDMRHIFGNSLVSRQPDLSITFVENHDTQPFQSLESPVDAWFKPLAYSLILLRQEGHPCVFYCDLYGTCYTHVNHEGEEKQAVMPKITALEKLLYARQKYAYGPQHDYFDDAHCVGWTREGANGQSGCVVLLSNAGEAVKTMHVGMQYAGKRFIDLLRDDAQAVYIDEAGNGEFGVGAGSAAVWIAND
ncbi:alpha-amylase [Emticicia fluvialis]|uniref:alpha-amylase n=1 Tax=Emticicia fluvialis TaxID=2974474 RepID=UPI002165B099|nr:alpha-amylase [Emticicia fluvialis]